jgi:molecular chaperone GrpE
MLAGMSDTESTTESTATPEAEAARAAAPEATETLENKLQTELAAAQADAAKFRDQLLRTAADFDNYRKRSRKEVDDAQKKGAEDLLRALLPVFDNLERAATHADQASDSKAIGEGVRMVLAQFTDTLERAGITRLAGVGCAFDPMVHEAVQQVETNDAPPGSIVAEITPGYRYGERLVRASMVVVAKAKTEAPSESN